MRKIRRIVIHCSAGSSAQKASDIKAYHLRPVRQGGRGWKAPGYHYVIEADGRVVATHPEHLVANGARGFNADSIHICYTGGIDGRGRAADTRTAAQRESMARLVASLRGRLGALPCCGHRDLSPDTDGNGRADPWEWVKACPCFDVSGCAELAPFGL